MSLLTLGRRALLASGAALVLSLASAPLVAGSASAADKKVRVGIVGDEDVEIWKIVAAEAAKHGLAVETVAFSDYAIPNEALNNRELEANAFQHKPYLDNQIASRGYKISPVGLTAVWPIGVYSRKHKSIAALPQGARIGVPNDPSNEGRALLVLQAQGLIRLKPGTGILATVSDIAENPKGIKISELDAGIVGRAVDDLDAAVVNTNWAFKAGLDLDKERIAQEAIKDNPYANFIAVRTADVDEPWVKTLVAAFQRDETKAALAKVYKGTAIPAW